MKNKIEHDVETSSTEHLKPEYEQSSKVAEDINDYDNVLLSTKVDAELNTTNLLKQQADNDNSSTYSLGQILRFKREKFNWTEDYVASRLHLKKSVIHHLENDEQIEVSATFLRGYVRAYAKLLGLPEQDLLAYLDRDNPLQVTSPKTFQTYVITKKRRRRDGWFKMFSGLVIFTTLGITGAWWWQNYQQDKKELGIMAEQQNSVSIPLANVVNNPSVNGSVLPLENISEKDTSQQIINTVTDSNAADNQNSIPLSPNQVLPDLSIVGSEPISDIASPTTNLSVQQAVVNALPQTNLPTEQAVAESDQKGIGFSFTGDSWLEVVDSNGKVLFSGMKRKDESLNFSEGAPFKLKLGAPATVNLTFDGRVVDLTDYMKTGRVARLTVPSTTTTSTTNASDSTGSNVPTEPVIE